MATVTPELPIAKSIRILRHRFFFDHSFKSKTFITEEYTIISRENRVQSILLTIPYFLINLKVFDSDGEQLPVLPNDMTLSLFESMIEGEINKLLQSKTSEANIEKFLKLIESENTIKKFLESDASKEEIKKFLESGASKKEMKKFLKLIESENTIKKFLESDASKEEIKKFLESGASKEEIKKFLESITLKEKINEFIKSEQTQEKINSYTIIKDVLDLFTKIDNHNVFLLWIRLPKDKELNENESRVINLEYDATKEKPTTKLKIDILPSNEHYVFYTIRQPEDFDLSKITIESANKKIPPLKYSDGKNQKNDLAYISSGFDSLSVTIKSKETNLITTRYSFKPAIIAIIFPVMFIVMMSVLTLYLSFPSIDNLFHVTYFTLFLLLSTLPLMK